MSAASFHQDTILTSQTGQLFNVITRRTGRMPGGRRTISPSDRWAIAACMHEVERKRLAGAADPPVGIK